MGTTKRTMKAFTLLPLLATAAAIPECQECLDSIERLLARITSEDSLAEQAAILTGTVCPGAPDPDACEAGLPVQWPIIGAVLFPEFLKGDAICGDTGVCREMTTAAMHLTLPTVGILWHSSSPLLWMFLLLPSQRLKSRFARMSMEFVEI